MKEQTLQAALIQKSLELSEQDALKVFIFVAGMNAGKTLQTSAEKSDKGNQECKGVLNALSTAGSSKH